ncbi:MAG TPA: TolC family protein [Verrucomicrobiae bacterium]|jgi:outer membrane protein TolC|nr:TolC family protein [Verrucomicrobiae bacterium]
MKRAFVIVILNLILLPVAVAQQGANSFELGSITTPRTINPAANSNTPSSLAGQQQNPFLGSVPDGEATATPIALSLEDAIGRGLRFNLGVVENQMTLRQAQAERLRALSVMLPNASALVRQNLDNLSSVAIGLKIPGLPASTGQFGYQEAYFSISENGLNFDAAYRLRAARRSAEAVAYSLSDARDIVVLAVGTAYLQVTASQSRLETARAQLEVARTLEAQTANQVRSGLSPEIDGFRATVQRQTNEQRVTVGQANLEKDKLTLARLIGLPRGQQFNPITVTQYQPWNGPELQGALLGAQQSRSDLKSAQTAAQAAALSKKAAGFERLPALSFNGYYGAIGTTLAHSNDTYALTATVSLPLFTGGRIRSDVQESAAQFQRKQSEYLDLAGRVDYEVRNAFVDLTAAEGAVHVAENNSQLAQKTLEQARDRFVNGVTNNLEVVQAQQELAAANENYISSLFAHNLAKLALLRAMGSAQKDAIQHLGGK